MAARVRIAPVVLLFFLAPLFGEFLLGNLTISELFYVPFLAPLYGGGAVLIRESARRWGRGYATMLVLGAAYAIIEEGLVDQLYFNPDYFAGQAEMMDTVVPGTGVDAWLVLVLFAMHAIWSTCVPIVLVEALFPSAGIRPWLGTVGYSLVAAIFVLGSGWLAYATYAENDFLATVPELVVAAVAAALLIGLAGTGAGAAARRSEAGFVPAAWLVGGLAFVASSLFMLTDRLPGWTKVIACLTVAVAFLAAVRRWSWRAGWSPVHRLAVTGGAIGTYAWLGAVMPPETGPKSIVDHVGTAVLVCAAAALWTVAVLRIRRHGSPPAAPDRVTRTEG